jgi:predicted metal-binding protein
MTSKHKILGVNDDRNFCECCGKVGLKRVVWIKNTETGEIVHYGTICVTTKHGCSESRV